MPGNVIVVVHLGDPDPGASRADVVLSVPADVGTSLHRDMTSRQMIHKLTARLELLPLTKLAVELHILPVGDGETHGSVWCMVRTVMRTLQVEMSRHGFTYLK